MHGGPQLSRQKEKTHQKKEKDFFSLPCGFFFLPWGFFFLPWGFFFWREVFSFDVRFFPFAMSLFLFSVSLFLLPRGYFFCRGVIAYAVTVKGHCTNVRPNEAWEAEEKIKESSPKKSTSLSTKPYTYIDSLVKIHFQSKVRLIKYLREVWATCQNRKMDDFLTSRLVKTAHWMRFAIIHVTLLWNRPGNKPTVFSLSSRMFYWSLLQERRK